MWGDFLLFKIGDKKEEVKDFCFVDECLYYGIYSFEEFKKVYSVFGIDISDVDKYEYIYSSDYHTICFNRLFLSGVIELYDGNGLFLKKDSFLFLVFKNIFLIVVVNDNSNRIYEVFDSVFKQVEVESKDISRVVYLFLNSLIIDDCQYIENLQEELDDIEKYNTQEQSTLFIGKLKRINKELMFFRRYYETLTSIGEELEIGLYTLLKKDNNPYMKIFVYRVTRLLNNVELLQELSIQLRDMHQSQLDYSMNKTMELFTVVTSIFMPLTLITGWYGMNFKYMPEIEFKYSYYVVIGISIGIVILCIYWFKKKKYF